MIRLLVWGLAAAALAAGCKGSIIVEEVEVSLSPLEGSQGQTITLFVTGIGTSFGEGDPLVGVVGSDEGLVLREVVVDNPHRARVQLRIEQAASTGDRTIRVETGRRSFDFPFRVLTSPSLPLVRLEPETVLAGIDGQDVRVIVLERSMTFVEGTTVVAFPEDSGVHLDAIQDWDDESLTAVISVGEDAPDRTFSVTVTTGSDVATHPFRVIGAGSGPPLYADPPEAQRGTTLDVMLRVEDMVLSTELTLSFPYSPPGAFTVDGLEFVSTTQARAGVTIAPETPVGDYHMVLRSSELPASGTFRVLPAAGTEPFLRLYPAMVERGVSDQAVHVSGVNTHFTVETEAGLSPGEGLAIESLSIAGASDAYVTVSAGDDAALGTSILSLTTGSEVASAALVVVEPEGLHVTVTPGEVEQGASGVSLALDVTGADLLAAVSVGVELPAESSICVRSVSLTAPGAAVVTVDVAESAPTGGTLLSLAVDGETATVPLVVTAAPRASGFTIDPPFIAVPSGDLAVELDGSDTAWQSGRHRLFFSDPSVEVLDFTVVGPRYATALVRGPAWIEERRVVAWIASPSDVAGAWWTVLTPAERGAGLSGGGEIFQGQTKSFAMTGSGTSFLAGITTAFVPPGSGLRVGYVNVVGKEQAAIVVEASTDAAPGTYGVTLGTGGEVALAPITVVEAASLPGASAFPAAILAGTSTYSLAISGTGTSFDPLMTEVRCGVPAHDVALGLSPTAAIRDATTIEVDIRPDASLAGTTLPLAITTDLEVVRACLSIVGEPGSSYPEVEPLAVRPGSSVTLAVTASGVERPDFLAAPPSAEPVSGAFSVGSVTVAGATQARIDLDVDPGATDAIELRIHGTGYTWIVALPVLDTPPSAVLSGSPVLLAGTRGGLFSVDSLGFDMSGTSLRAASPGRVVFVDDVEPASTTKASVAFDSAVDEGPSSTLLYIMPESTPWSVPVALDLGPALVSILGVPSSLLETIPSTGYDLAGFTPAADARLGLWSVLDGADVGPPMQLVSEDGITVEGRSSGGSVLALLGAASSRHYVIAGGGAHAGEGCWTRVEDVLSSSLQDETEPNDDWTSAEGISTLPVLASIAGPCDRDVFDLPDFVSPRCWEAVSTRWTGDSLTSPYLVLSLLGVGGAEIARVEGGVGTLGMDPILCRTVSGGEYLQVESLAGTSGSYLLVPRPPLIVSEVDHAVDFVEVSGPPGFSLTSYVVEIQNLSGTTVGSASLASLGAVPSDGLVVVAAPGAVPGADVESAAMSLMVAPFIVRVGHTGHLTYDKVQVGGSTPSFGEGAPLDPSLVPAGRLWGMDTNHNDLDFRQLLVATPGAANALPVP